MKIQAKENSEAAKHRHIYQLIGGHPALDLVNTLDWRFRETTEELLANYGDIVRFAEQSGLIGKAQARRLLQSTPQGNADAVLAQARELREAVAQVLYASLERASPSATAMKTLEGFFKSAMEQQRLAWENSKLAWDFQSGSAAELPFWLLSIECCRLMTSDSLDRLRECGNPECRWLFLDTSKNHTRRWCDMKICGNRMKARRFKAQHR